jgi:hypothetical protein
VSDIRLRVETDVEGEGAGQFLVTTKNVGNGTDVTNDQFTIIVF